MTIVTNRQIERSALRARIYDAAISEFRSNGIETTTVEAITKRARVAKGTFFNFYRSKIDVLVEYYWTIEVRIAPLRSELRADRPLNSLIDYATKVEREFNREGPLIVDLITELMRNDTLRSVDRASGNDDRSEFAAFFARARTAGTVRPSLDPNVAASIFGDLWAGSVREWISADRGRPLSRILKLKLIDVFRGFEDKESANAS